MGVDDEELIDSWLREHYGVFSCPICKKKLGPSVMYSMLRVLHTRGGRFVAPNGTTTCPTCGAALRLKFGTTLGKIAVSLGFLVAIIGLAALLIYVQSLGNAPISDYSMIYFIAVSLGSMLVGSAIYQNQRARQQRVIAVSSQR